MIDKIKVLEIIQDALNGTDKFLVNLKITNDNRIFVDIDGDEGILIDDCIELSRTIENSLDRDVEDFELNVSSAGADSPLKLPRQYRRNIGRQLQVETLDGEKVTGRLEEADDTQCSVKVRGTKNTNGETFTFKYADIKVARVLIEF
ncbi:MAG: ribosome assembly cofactor RimP [Bacteroidales bacterium]|nr:ribosome assembly cofactor RimP [Candidatus Colimorpha pelethequi]MCQ2261717.1 ribosome assembly cofactor RimP [Bacteroidales bacterium]